MCSIFLDTQFPGAREVIDPDGLLGQADIARLPSIHPRASELEFLKDLRALEVHPDPAVSQHGDQLEMSLGRHSAQQAPSEESGLTAEVLTMLSLKDMHQASEGAVKGGHNSSPSRKWLPQPKGKAIEAPASPGTPPKKRKTRQSRGLMPKPAQSAHMRSDNTDMDVLTDDSDEGEHTDPDQNMPRQRPSSVEVLASQQVSLRPPPWKAKRRRTWRSEDSDPSWQPADEPHRTSPIEGATGLVGVADKDPEGSMAVTVPATRRRGPQYAALAAAAHVPKSRYKGVSCHK